LIFSTLEIDFYHRGKLIFTTVEIHIFTTVEIDFLLPWKINLWNFYLYVGTSI